MNPVIIIALSSIAKEIDPCQDGPIIFVPICMGFEEAVTLQCFWCKFLYRKFLNGVSFHKFVCSQRLYFLLKILFNLSLDILRKRQNIIKSEHKKGKHLRRDLLIYRWILFKIHFRCFPWYRGKYLISKIFENLKISLSWVVKWHIRHQGHYVLLMDYSVKVEIVPFINKN